MEEIESLVERLRATLTPEEEERVGPVLEELQQAAAALRLAQTVGGDALEALELARRLSEQAREDYRRGDAHVRRASELLTSEADAGEE